MKKMLFCLVCFWSFFSFGQTSELGNWLICFGNKQLSPKWNLHFEGQYRNYNFIGDMEQLLLRTGLGYNLSDKNNNLLLGYGFIRSENYMPGLGEKTGFDEHRLFQQFITKQKFGRFNLLHRYRFEQRWFENQNTLYRFRYFLSTNVALNKSEITDRTCYLSSYNEIFISAQGTFFDRNRFYAGLGYQLNSMFRFELGYMNQRLNLFSRDQINAIIFLNLP